ncbi:hypothetical protein RJ639_033096 [Escallonia herrerae]|uniref:Mediator of RNA polymerase II transcription subunit 31 n=1 Tax=Escallonia herrerae TaxID=1293975 RepID=A0AA88WSD3_9ASTE|nr:hypothetical protein RJ639_033096 [Escallonia herrerae]
MMKQPILHLRKLIFSSSFPLNIDCFRPKSIYKDPDDGRQRFLLELEFVQCLANPTYIHYLAQNRYFEDEAFIGYLKYLMYCVISPGYDTEEHNQQEADQAVNREKGAGSNQNKVRIRIKRAGLRQEDGVPTVTDQA